MAGADLFINSWEAGNVDGTTYGINPSYSIGDRHAFSITVPIHATDPDSGEDFVTIGVDGLYKFNFSDAFAMGAHVNYLKSFSDDDRYETYSVTGGPFVSYLMQLTDKMGLSLGVLVDFTSPEEGDNYTEIIPGVNLGYNLDDNWAINTYYIGYYDADAEDNQDEFFNDLGAEISLCERLLRR